MPDAYGQETEAERAKRELRSRAGHAQAPTDFTNFGRRFGANKAAAQGQAGKYAQQATDAANKAGDALKKSQAAFTTGVNTGTVQGPGGAPSTNTGAAAVSPSSAAPVAPQAAPAPAAPAVDPAAVEAWNNYDMGKAPRPPGADPRAQATPASAGAGALTGVGTRPSETSGYTLAEMLGHAGEKYSGPDALADEGGAIAAANAKAQQQLDMLGSNRAAGITAEDNLGTLVNESGRSGSRGADMLSGSLIGAAGHQQFDALRSKFNPNKELLDAQAKALETAKQARETSEKNAGEWGRLGGIKGTEEAQQKAFEDAQTKGRTDQATAKAAWEEINKRKPPPADSYNANKQKSDWDKEIPANKKLWVERIAKDGTTAAGYGFKATPWSGPGLTPDEIMRIIDGMTPDEFTRVMSGSSAESNQYRSDWFKARAAANAAGVTGGNNTGSAKQ